MNSRRIVPALILVVVIGVVGWSLFSPRRQVERSGDDSSAATEVATTAPNGSKAPGSVAPAAGTDTVRSPEPTAATATEPNPAAELPDLGPHPELVGIDGWMQSDIDSLDDLDGTVYAVQFWTFGCYNCKNTLPHLQDLYAKYRDQGFEIVGVHSPEFDHEADPANIANAADELGVTWPIALDPSKDSFHEWQPGRAVWPRIFIIDRDGNVRLDHKGEGAYDEIDAAVGALLAEPS